MADDPRIVIETGLDARIAAIAEPVIQDLGCRLVRVRVSGQNGVTVQIMAERPTGLMTISDCEKISKALSPELDVHDPISGAYHLEVSTAGVDRPLVRKSDFERWAGHLARVEMAITIGGQRRFRGQLLGLRDAENGLEFGLRPMEKRGRKTKVKSTEKSLATPEADVWLPLADVADANLIMTDELIDAARALLKSENPDLDAATEDGQMPELDGDTDLEIDTEPEPNTD
ncbi:MAG: ribosome maturation factor RimP [Hyphomicrobiales bacterium]